MNVNQGFARLLGAAAMVAAVCAVAAPVWAQPLPKSSRPGCYAKIAYAPVYRTVQVRAPGPPVVTYRDRPAVIEHSARQVLVAPARVEHIAVPPVYRTVTRWIDVPGPTRTVFSPPVYRTVTARRLISPARLVWRRGGVAHGFVQGNGQDGGYGQQVRPTGEVLCRVLIPARYGWTRRRVLVSPGHRTEVQGPTRHLQVRQQALVSPGRTADRVVPATYRTVDAARVVRPASRERIVSPGPVRLIARRVLATPARYGWAPIVCTPAPAAPTMTYGGGYGGPQPRPSGRAWRPDEILAPTPVYPSTPAPPSAAAPKLVPAPYDVGHPAR